MVREKIQNGGNKRGREMNYKGIFKRCLERTHYLENLSTKTGRKILLRNSFTDLQQLLRFFLGGGVVLFYFIFSWFLCEVFASESYILSNYILFFLSFSLLVRASFAVLPRKRSAKKRNMLNALARNRRKKKSNIWQKKRRKDLSISLFQIFSCFRGENVVAGWRSKQPWKWLLNYKKSLQMRSGVKKMQLGAKRYCDKIRLTKFNNNDNKTVIPIVIGALNIVTKGFIQRLEDLEIRVYSTTPAD